MINFRYHVVSLAAVLLALAAGVVLGAGYLNKPATAENNGAAASADEGVAAFNSGYAERTSGNLVGDRLKDRSVVIVTTPGASSADVRGIRKALEGGGATVAGELEFTGKLLDSGGRQFADEVVERSAAEIDEVASAPAGYQRVGAALARAYLTADGTDLDDQATQLNSALDEAGLVSGGGELKQRAELAVVVTSAPSGEADQQGAPLAALAGSIDERSKGVVIAGPASSSQSDGIIAAVRDSEQASAISTVDVSDLPAGRTVVALAAIAELDGQGGAWGTSRSAGGSLPK